MHTQYLEKQHAIEYLINTIMKNLKLLSELAICSSCNSLNLCDLSFPSLEPSLEILILVSGSI